LLANEAIAEAEEKNGVRDAFFSKGKNASLTPFFFTGESSSAIDVPTATDRP
jgi:hypothetical protein